MPHEIKGFIMLTVILILTWWVITLLLNDKATKWIDDREEQIKKVLIENHMVFITYSYYDCAPCDVKYSVSNNLVSDDDRYLCPSKTKSALLKFRNGKFSSTQLIDYFETYGKPIHIAKP